MKLLEVKGTEAIEMLADLIDPISEIAADAEILACIQTEQKAKAIKFALKNHAKEIVQILAICEGVPEEDYHPSVVEIPAKILEIVNHPDIAKLFTSQAQTEALLSGSVTENIGANSQ